MDAETIKDLEQLRTYRDKQVDAAKSLFKQGKTSEIDVLCMAAFKRSLSLLRAFCDLVDSENVIAAESLVRLELDTCLRLYAAFCVENPHQFVHDVLRGTPINKLRARSGETLTDAFLYARFAQLFEIPTILDIYHQGSDFIHLSNKHVLLFYKEAQKKVLFDFAGRDSDGFDEDYRYAISMFRVCAELFLKLASAWDALRSKSPPASQAQYN